MSILPIDHECLQVNLHSAEIEQQMLGGQCVSTQIMRSPWLGHVTLLELVPRRI